MLGREEHRLDVDLHHATPVLFALVDDGATAADADVVVEEIETAESIDGRLDHRGALAPLGDIGLEGHALAARLGDHLDRALGKAAVAIDDDDLGPGLREQDGGRATVADAVTRGAAAGDDRDLAREPPLVRNVDHASPATTHRGARPAATRWMLSKPLRKRAM